MESVALIVYSSAPCIVITLWAAAKLINWKICITKSALAGAAGVPKVNANSSLVRVFSTASLYAFKSNEILI